MDPLKRRELSNFGCENSLDIFASAHDYANNLPIFLQQQQCHELLLHRQQQQQQQQHQQFSSLTLHQQLRQQQHEQRAEPVRLPSLQNFHSLISDSVHNLSSHSSSQNMQLTIKLEDANNDLVESISDSSKRPSSVSPSSVGILTQAGVMSISNWPTNPSRKPSGDSMGSTDSNLCSGVPKLEPAPNLTSQRQRPHTNKQTFECPNCGKIFSNSSAIAKHKLTHSDERKYVCSICKKAFKRQDHLNGHLLTHQDKKPHACKYCDKSYSDARSLRRHYENAHSEELRQLHEERCRQRQSLVISPCPSFSVSSTPCSAYGAGTSPTLSSMATQHSPHAANSSSSNSGLSPSLNTAAGVSVVGGIQLASSLSWHPLDEPRNVECNYCSKKFKNQSALNGHMRLHGGYNLRRDDGPPILVAATSPEHNDLAATQQLQPHSWQTTSSLELPLMDNLISTPPPQPEPQATASISMCTNTVTDLSLLGSVGEVSLHTSLESIFQGMHCVSDDLDSMITDSFLGKATPPNSMSTPPHSTAFSRPHYEPITPGFFSTPSTVSASTIAHNDPRRCGSSTVMKTLEYTDGDPTLSNLNCSALAQLESVLDSDAVTSLTTSGVPLSSEEMNLARPLLFHERNKRLSLPMNTCWSHNLDLEATSTLDSLDISSTSDLLFRDPAVPPPTRRFKHRPAPLVIPAHVSNYAFASRLRSPRIWKPHFPVFGGGGRGESSPPPYTPPPMLSPMRQGSGLFWRISSLSGGSSFFKTGPMSAPVTRKPWTQVFQMDMLNSDLAVDRQCEEVDVESDLPPPATDILPKINIGDQYQADLPHLRPRVEAELDVVRARLLWDPECEKRLTEDEVCHYLHLSCSAAVPHGGLNQEHALHLLHRCQGNLQKAILHLLENSLKLCVNDPLADYTYTETEFWSLDDATRFTEALDQYEKDFYLVSQKLQQQGIERSVKHCVEFYYLWKHIWPQEYKVLHNRWRRRRAEQLANIPGGASGVAGAAVGPADTDTDTQLPNSWYNLRSREVTHDSFYDDELNCCSDSAVPFDSLTLPMLDAPENTWSAPESPSELDLLATAADMENHYPCKMCGRVFGKMKSRNAHMKSHNERNIEAGSGGGGVNRIQRRILPDLAVM